MAPLARSRPPVSTPRQSRGPVTLPPYEPLAHPLTVDSQLALQNLSSNHKLDSLKDRMKKANELLTESAGEINDNLHSRIERHEKARKKREQLQSSQQSDEAENEALENMREKTGDMTKILEEKVRRVIDLKADLDNVERVLRELNTNAMHNQGALAPTQSTLGASQFRGSKRRRVGNEDEDDEGDSTPIETVSTVDTLKRKHEEHKEEYGAKSLADRYASHNDYIGFKQIVHDAQYPEDAAPPLPHASTWFSSQGPGTQASSGGVAGTPMDAEDNDFLIESERITMKCPITLRIMKDPVKSKKCVHNFEKDAILEMMDMGLDAQQRRAGIEGSMKCPECEVQLTAKDLEPNPILLRKIKRIQAAERRQNEDSDDDDDSNERSKRPTQGEEITSSPPNPRLNIKRERMSQASRRDASMVPSTQINQID